MAGLSSKRKRPGAEKSNAPAPSIVNAQLTATMPLRSRASASAEPRALSTEQAVELGAEEQHQHDSAGSLQSQQNEHDEQQERNESSDDDEAPEAISVSTSRAQARAAEAAQAKAIKEARSKSKTKRKERQHRLDEQARERKVKRRKQELEEPSAGALSDEDAKDVAQSGHEGLDIDMDHGDLLPASLLAQISDVRPDTPPPESADSDQKARKPTSGLIKKGVLTLPSTEAPRDLNLPAMSVSVLSDRNERLAPPKSRSKENSVIGNWLRGRHSIAAAITARKKGVKVKSGRVTRKPFGLKKGFF